ncbi:MAG: hypothetical protein COA49_04405 [Bacteroidetes bacterium]|nr:MAG: hypothetical protein COA49_04405 [Bacteroidota bacterium]
MALFFLITTKVTVLKTYIKYQSTVIILLILGLVSCGKFSDGVVHEVAFPENEPRLSATLIVNDEDEVIITQVSATASVLDAAGPQSIPNAIISLTNESGQTIYSLGSDNFSSMDSLYHLDLDENFGTLTGEITLAVDAPDFEIVTAKSTMPPKPSFTYTYEYRGDSTITPWGEGYEYQDKFILDLENDLTRADNYLVFVDVLFEDIVSGNSNWENQLLTYRPDNRITYNNITNGLLISDDNTDSNSAYLSEITFFSKNFETGLKWSPTSLRLRIQALSPELASYYKSVDMIMGMGLDIFSEPTLVYSNLSGGFGCFGLASESIVIVE